MAMCQAFTRAGLAPPEALRLGPAGMEETDGDLDMPDIEALVRDLIPEDVSGYPASMILREALGAMPGAAAALFVRQMIAQAQPDLVALGRYMLLDPVPEMRAAAAEGFADLAHAGAMDAAVLSDLIRLRKWLPDDASKSALDIGIREGLRREVSGGAVPRAWTVHRLMTSLPDGTGSQSILASVSRGREKCIASVLLKAGHGIKDAYAIPCTSASDQRTTLAEIEAGVPLHEVPPGYLPGALAQAMGKGLEHGMPPAPGFLDVSQMLGLGDLVSAEKGAPLSIADPEGFLDTVSAQKRGRLIGRSLQWVQHHEMSSSWFVTDADLSDALAHARTERQAEKAVWDRLEQQRAFWARLFARAASVLRHADDPDWKSFAAVVQGLETGRALKKIPIFEMIAALTLDVAEQEGHDARAPDMQGDAFDEALFDPQIAPEKQGEFARLLRPTSLNPDSVQGYLTAVLVAPEFVTPADWLPPLFEGISFEGEDSVQRLLDILMLRYGALRTALEDGDIDAGLRELKPRAFSDWLSGFAMGAAIPAAWPKRALSRDDKKVFALINEAAQDTQTQSTLKSLLPSWLSAMGAKALQG